ncbi:hypothetical protein T439DRAFT_329455 [Meredithblackwellia eburnea MCA 4105]
MIPTSTITSAASTFFKTAQAIKAKLDAVETNNERLVELRKQIGDLNEHKLRLSDELLAGTPSDQGAKIKDLMDEILERVEKISTELNDQSKIKKFLKSDNFSKECDAIERAITHLMRQVNEEWHVWHHRELIRARGDRDQHALQQHIEHEEQREEIKRIRLMVGQIMEAISQLSLQDRQSPQMLEDVVRQTFSEHGDELDDPAFSDTASLRSYVSNSYSDRVKDLAINTICNVLAEAHHVSPNSLPNVANLEAPVQVLDTSSALPGPTTSGFTKFQDLEQKKVDWGRNLVVNVSQARSLLSQSNLIQEQLGIAICLGPQKCSASISYYFPTQDGSQTWKTKSWDVRWANGRFDLPTRLVYDSHKRLIGWGDVELRQEQLSDTSFSLTSLFGSKTRVETTFVDELRDLASWEIGLALLTSKRDKYISYVSTLIECMIRYVREHGLCQADEADLTWERLGPTASLVIVSPIPYLDHLLSSSKVSIPFTLPDQRVFVLRSEEMVAQSISNTLFLNPRNRVALVKGIQIEDTRVTFTTQALEEHEGSDFLTPHSKCFQRGWSDVNYLEVHPKIYRGKDFDVPTEHLFRSFLFHVLGRQEDGKSYKHTTVELLQDVGEFENLHIYISGDTELAEDMRRRLSSNPYAASKSILVLSDVSRPGKAALLHHWIYFHLFSGIPLFEYGASGFCSYDPSNAGHVQRKRNGSVSVRNEKFLPDAWIAIGRRHTEYSRGDLWTFSYPYFPPRQRSTWLDIPVLAYHGKNLPMYRKYGSWCTDLNNEPQSLLERIFTIRVNLTKVNSIPAANLPLGSTTYRPIEFVVQIRLLWPPVVTVIPTFVTIERSRPPDDQQDMTSDFLIWSEGYDLLLKRGESLPCELVGFPSDSECFAAL